VFLQLCDFAEHGLSGSFRLPLNAHCGWRNTEILMVDRNAQAFRTGMVSAKLPKTKLGLRPRVFSRSKNVFMPQSEPTNCTAVLEHVVEGVSFLEERSPKFRPVQ
jgi:hypothetical protein